MPHIVVEYSANLERHLDPDVLVRAVHDAALAHGLAPLDGLRTRAARRDHALVADGDPSFAFVAVWARIGPGRTPEARSGFVTALVDAVEALCLPFLDEMPVMISGEVTELDAEHRINRNHVRPRLVRGDGTGP